jgi:hypothetical protein
MFMHEWHMSKSLFRNIRWNYLTFQVLTAASRNMTTFWLIAPCSLVEVVRRFRGACCLRNEDDDKTAREKSGGVTRIGRTTWSLGQTNGERGDDQARKVS